MTKESLKRLEKNIEYLKNHDVGKVNINTFLKMIFYGVDLTDEEQNRILDSIVKGLNNFENSAITQR